MYIYIVYFANGKSCCNIRYKESIKSSYILSLLRRKYKKSVGECVISKKSEFDDIYLFAKHSFLEKIVQYYCNLWKKL